MPYCSNCGESLKDNTKFCHNCGCETSSTNVTGRSSINQGSYYNSNKCPNCGSMLKSLTNQCPSCGYELRSGMSFKSVQDFAIRLSAAKSVEQKSILVRSYPIPNTKEGIIEYFILASTNIEVAPENSSSKGLSDAWIVKIEQSYEKADLIFRGEPEFLQIKQLYDKVHNKMKKAKTNQSHKRMGRIIITNLGALASVATIIGAIVKDRQGDNVSLMELIAALLLIITASTLTKRGATLVDCIITACACVLSIVLASQLDNGSIQELAGGIAMIIVTVQYFRTLSRKNE
jgi:hypothetical protein